MVNAFPGHMLPPVPPAQFARIRQRTIFECCKWDPQSEDVTVLSEAALVLDPGVWEELSRDAAALSSEAMAAEEELLYRPDLLRRLGLPYRVRLALLRAREAGATPGVARVMRFDFHYTAEGWRISEANADVPGGYNEASGFTRLMAGCYPGLRPCGDPAAALASSLARTIGSGGTVAMVHATAYADDRQVMEFLANSLDRHQLKSVALAPDHIKWEDGRARCAVSRSNGAIDAIIRFFPAEWMIHLPRACRWWHFFSGGNTPVCSPGVALLSQSKRFPLVWDSMTTPMKTWKRLLPPARDPRGMTSRDRDHWVLKPAFGRCGTNIGMPGVSSQRDMKRIRLEAWLRPHRWAAQERFEHVPVLHEGRPGFVCVGVYTVDGAACGAYGRIAMRPLIDGRARDLAILVSGADNGQERGGNV